jgi:hypothetical protein
MKTFNRKERKWCKEERTNHEGTKFKSINFRTLRDLRAFVVNIFFSSGSIRCAAHP